jgi:hypothetical protein|tara:strand:- start:40 stop:360 length:321 start_codon:yes stop_codon:yes gene_type:complete
MALTLAKVKSGVQGDLAYWIGTATWDSAYAVGGESLTAANVGMSVIYQLTLTNDFSTSTTAVMPIWDKSADKIMLFESTGSAAPMTETDTDDLSALITYIKAEGRR